MARRTTAPQESLTSSRRRRAIALLSSLALLDAAVVALRQLGAISHLPEPPGPSPRTTW
jgi:hypothetical protein